MRQLVWGLCAACRFHGGSASTVAADAASDAAIDAPACAVTYTLAIASTTSRYRVISSEDVFTAQHAACNADGAHLVAFETALEVQQIETLLATYTPAAASDEYFIGAVQAPSQSAPDVGWYVFTGPLLPSGQWGSGEPDDSGGGEDNAENLGAIHATSMLHDTIGTIIHGAVCECDGKPIDATVAMYIP